MIKGAVLAISDEERLERRREYTKKYVQANRERVRAKQNEWKANNKERYDKSVREYYEKNKVEINRKRRENGIVARGNLNKLKIKEVNKRILREEYGPLVCARCGYDHFVALDAHHIDKSQKRNYHDTLSHWIVVRRGFREKIKSIKFVLLCKNCHTELHSNEWKLEELCHR